MKDLWSLTCMWCVVALYASQGVAQTEDSASEEGEVEIPLEEIWAWDMPGTRDIRLLEPEYFDEKPTQVSSKEQLQRFDRSQVSRMLRSLTIQAKQDHGDAGFVVAGEGLVALRKAHAVLANEHEPSTTFSAADDLSAVFFSRLFGSYVHVKQVLKRRNEIEIQYQFVPHLDAEQTVHLAIIPLGTMQPGRVSIDVVRAPTEENIKTIPPENVLKEWESRIVCRSFQFVVNER